MSCKICGTPPEEHGGRIHPYTPEGDPGAGITNDRKAKKAAGVGGDPALRIALIEAGLITTEQLSAAEEALRNARSSGTPYIPRTPAPAVTSGSDAGSGDSA